LAITGEREALHTTDPAGSTRRNPKEPWHRHPGLVAIAAALISGICTLLATLLAWQLPPFGAGSPATPPTVTMPPKTVAVPVPVLITVPGTAPAATPGKPKPKPSTTQEPKAAAVYLTDLSAAEDSLDHGSYKLGGRTYPHTLGTAEGYCDGKAIYQLTKPYDKLTGTLGITEASAARADNTYTALLTVTVDGTTHDFSAGTGKPKRIEVPIGEASRVEVELRLSCGGTVPTVVLADAQLVPSS